jgi:hypothetical protein
VSGRSRGDALRWGVAALLGVAVAVALTLATLRLTDQHVGLAGGLVPAATATRAAPAAPAATVTRTVTVTVPPTSSPAPAGEDDGNDRGKGARSAPGDD